jgi:hypothetical protein
MTCENIDAVSLGENVRGPDHHLARCAAPVRAFAADESSLDADDRQSGQRELAADLLAADAEPEDDYIHPSYIHLSHGAYTFLVEPA